MRALRSAAPDPQPFLWITSGRSVATPAGARVLAVRDPPEDGEVDLRRPQDLRSRVAAFLGGREGGVVVVDCLDALALQNGTERTVRALQDLHEEVASHDAILAILFDPRRAGPRMLAWLEREFEFLPAATDVALAGGFSA